MSKHETHEHEQKSKEHAPHPEHEEHAKGPHDPNEINPKLTSDIAYWAKEFHVTGNQLHEAICAHGTHVESPRGAYFSSFQEPGTWPLSIGLTKPHLEHILQDELKPTDFYRDAF